MQETDIEAGADEPEISGDAQPNPARLARED